MNREEQWKPVLEYNGLYEVSDFGKVRKISKNGYLERKLQKHKNGYYQLSIWLDGVVKNYLVHRLVIEAFVGKSDLVVDHINGIKTDNRLSNLRYCTQRENSVFENKAYKKQKSSKYVGVTWNATSKIWQSAIKINGKRKHLGVFVNEDEASNSYQTALKKII